MNTPTDSRDILFRYKTDPSTPGSDLTRELVYRPVIPDPDGSDGNQQTFYIPFPPDRWIDDRGFPGNSFPELARFVVWALNDRPNKRGYITINFSYVYEGQTYAAQVTNSHGEMVLGIKVTTIGMVAELTANNLTVYQTDRHRFPPMFLQDGCMYKYRRVWDDAQQAPCWLLTTKSARLITKYQDTRPKVSAEVTDETARFQDGQNELRPVTKVGAIRKIVNMIFASPVASENKRYVRKHAYSLPFYKMQMHGIDRELWDSMSPDDVRAYTEMVRHIHTGLNSKTDLFLMLYRLALLARKFLPGTYDRDFFQAYWRDCLSRGVHRSLSASLLSTDVLAKPEFLANYEQLLTLGNGEDGESEPSDERKRLFKQFLEERFS